MEVIAKGYHRAHLASTPGSTPTGRGICAFNQQDPEPFTAMNGRPRRHANRGWPLASREVLCRRIFAPRLRLGTGPRASGYSTAPTDVLGLSVVGSECPVSGLGVGYQSPKYEVSTSSFTANTDSICCIRCETDPAAPHH